MASYLIHYKVATTSELPEAFNLDNFHFSSYKEEWWESNGWLVSKEVQGNSMNEARSVFIRGLIPKIERIVAVSQCAFRIFANSYFIYRSTNNSDQLIYVYFVKEVGHTGLHFDRDEIAQLSKFDSLANPKGLFYLMEAADSSTFYTRLMMLLGSAEGFAGETMREGRIETNKKILKEILGVDLYNQLYAYRTGLRHKLLHGNIETNGIPDDLNDQLYGKIVRYLRDNFDIQINEGVVHPQRNTHGNFRAMGALMKFNNEPLLDLRKIEEVLDDDRPDHTRREREIFTYSGLNPNDY